MERAIPTCEKGRPTQLLAYRSIRCTARSEHPSWMYSYWGLRPVRSTSSCATPQKKTQLEASAGGAARVALTAPTRSLKILHTFAIVLFDPAASPKAISTCVSADIWHAAASRLSTGSVHQRSDMR